jgi:uncharacterized delta-60 repeat protein
LGVSGLTAESLQLQPDGDLVVGGEGNWPSTVFVVASFTANGKLDTSFGGGNGYVTNSFGTDDVGHMRLAVYPTTGTDTADYGKIVAVCSINGNSGGINSGQIALARFNADGTLDSTFGQSGEVVTPFPHSGGTAWATALQGDGKIVVAGQTASNGNWNFSLLRYNTDGSLDTTFSNSYGSQIFPNGGLVVTPSGTPNSPAFAVAIQPDGRIVAAGRVQVAAGSGDYNFVSGRYLVGPQIGSFMANPNPVTAGSSVTLTASNISDGDPNSSITQVALYLDSNNDGKLDSGDTLLSYATQTSPGVWTLTNSSAFGLTAGNYTLFAQAEDGFGVLGDPDALTLTVEEYAAAGRFSERRFSHVVLLFTQDSECPTCLPRSAFLPAATGSTGRPLLAERRRSRPHLRKRRRLCYHLGEQLLRLRYGGADPARRQNPCGRERLRREQ